MNDWTEEQLDKYFLGLGCELWPGEAFYLTDPKQRAKAIEWAKELIFAIEH